jgi:GNAT superfamily N-acetyltransferase
MTVRVVPLTGDDIAPLLPEIARLRITVFRAWPYLYDGTLDYEEGYLRKFAEAPGAVISAAFDDETLVGCATAAPLDQVEAEFAAPFQARAMNVSKIFYCGESVLLTSHRGHGIGHDFFDHREQRARDLGGFTHSTFCAVVRQPVHPLKPKDYQPLDPFWAKRGYAKVEGMTTEFNWKDIDQPDETAKTMQFWMKAL